MSKDMEWYRKLVGSASVNAVAARTGVVQSTLNRQVHKGALTAEVVAAVARGYDIDVVGALIATGFISEADVRRHGAQHELSDATDREIVDEVMRRLSASNGPTVFDRPMHPADEAEAEAKLAAVRDGKRSKRSRG